MSLRPRSKPDAAPSGQGSREHHWWPVGLQKHWTDASGNLSFINPHGRVSRKKAANRKVAKKAHGHTVLMKGPWTTNFEPDFERADDSINAVLSSLEQYKAKGGSSFWDFLKLMSLLSKRDRTLRDMCRYHELDSQLAAAAALLIVSLLIRLPARRHVYEGVSQWVGLPPDPNIGKMNMRQFFHIARDAIEKGAASRMFFVLIRSPLREFIYGDGVLDWMSDSFASLQIRGRALLPLTPKLCVYVCTPSVRFGRHNCASFYAAPWMVDAINEMTQIYSKDFLFFRSKPPVLTEHFKSEQFLSHELQRDDLLELLDDVARGGRVGRFEAQLHGRFDL